MYTSAYQSTHCGKAERNVSVQAHSSTSMKAPGLKIIYKIQFQPDLSTARLPPKAERFHLFPLTMEKLARTGDAWAQLLMFA